MRNEKKSFILYIDQEEVINQLTDEEAGKLLKLIYAYQIDNTTEIEDRLITMIFTPIKLQFIRDNDKYDEIKENRSEAGKRSAVLRKATNLNKPQQTSTKLNKAQQTSTKLNKAQQEATNPTDNVTDTVNGNVNDNVNGNDIKISLTPQREKKFVKPSIFEIKKYCDERKNSISAEKFHSHYESQGWRIGKVSMKSWKSAIHTWELRSKEDKAPAVNSDYDDRVAKQMERFNHIN